MSQTCRRLPAPVGPGRPGTPEPTTGTHVSDLSQTPRPARPRPSRHPGTHRRNPCLRLVSYSPPRSAPAAQAPRNPPPEPMSQTCLRLPAPLGAGRPGTPEPTTGTHVSDLSQTPRPARCRPPRHPGTHHRNPCLRLVSDSPPSSVPAAQAPRNPPPEPMSQTCLSLPAPLGPGHPGTPEPTTGTHVSDFSQTPRPAR